MNKFHLAKHKPRRRHQKKRHRQTTNEFWIVCDLAAGVRRRQEEDSACLDHTSIPLKPFSILSQFTFATFEIFSRHLPLVARTTYWTSWMRCSVVSLLFWALVFGDMHVDNFIYNLYNICLEASLCRVNRLYMLWINYKRHPFTSQASSLSFCFWLISSPPSVSRLVLKLSQHIHSTMFDCVVDVQLLLHVFAAVAVCLMPNMKHNSI